MKWSAPWTAVSLLLYSHLLAPQEVNAFKFPSDLNTEQKKTFIEKVGKFEKKFQTSKFIRNSVKEIKKHTHGPTHGPIVQTHKDNTFQRQTGGLIRDSIYARYFNLQFDYQDAQDFVAGFSYQVFNDLFLYNAEDCTFWSFDTFSDMMNSFLLLVEDNKPDESILSFGYSIHKAPVAYYTCTPIVDDYKMIVDFYTQATQTPDKWGSLMVKVFWNVFFNWPDIYYEYKSFENEFEKRNWTMLGTALAKMFTDICFKAPIDESWNYKNSDVVTDEWGEPPNLIQGVNDLWIWIGQESFLSDDQLQENDKKIKDASDLDFDDPGPQNVDIFDDDDNNDNNDNNNSNNDDQSSGEIIITNGSKRPSVRSQNPESPSHQQFNALVSSVFTSARDAPISTYMQSQLLMQDAQLLNEQSEKVQRLTNCVRTKGPKEKELTRQAKAIFKILDHVRSKHGYVQVEPLLDFTLHQYHCY